MDVTISRGISHDISRVSTHHLTTTPRRER